MLFKESLIWAFWGQNLGPGWVKNGEKKSSQPAQPYYQPSFP